KERPIIGENDRAEMLAALACVDFVTIFDEEDPRAFLKMVKPHKHVKSRSGYLGIEEEVVRSGGGEVVLVDDIGGISTSAIIKKIQALPHDRP
ncbi:hypothetical protein D6783_05115, partial [Candidatus Woesearchaeota archaeon]